MDARGAAAAIEQHLRAAGTRERALHEKRYLKSDLEFLGASVWEIRRVVRTFFKEHPDLRRAELLELVGELWSKPIHERRMAAALLLEAYVERLEARDLRFVERLIRESKTWALVDTLAEDVAGAIVARGGETRKTLDAWATDGDFWVRRSAILALLEPLKRGGDFDQFGRYADQMLEEKEFFIRKAIGWVLRETAKKRPDDVWAWLEPRVHRASGVTLREAIKYLDTDRKTRALQAVAYRRRPSGTS